MNLKKCTQCERDLPANEEYFYKQGDKLHAWCKKCFLAYRKEHQQRKDVKKRNSQYIKEYYIYNKEKFSYKNRDINKFKEYQKEYRQRESTKKKYKIYNQKRKDHKTHQISSDEWIACKEYFNKSCAYCELSEKDAKKLYGQRLHKEHVEHVGSNDLSNCVPACKSCNSSKNTHKLEDWYTEENNKNYKKERLDKIHKWLKKDYLKHYENKLYN